MFFMDPANLWIFFCFGRRFCIHEKLHIVLIHINLILKLDELEPDEIKKDSRTLCELLLIILGNLLIIN